MLDTSLVLRLKPALAVLARRLDQIDGHLGALAQKHGGQPAMARTRMQRALPITWGDRIAEVRAVGRDAKTALQEWAQARGLPPPNNLDLGREGPDHAPVFSVEARLADGRAAAGRAAAERAAQQAAAEALLARVQGP